MRLLRRGDSSSSLDLLVVGLGNPGREYANTRHNVGWMVVDELARRTARLPRQVLRPAGGDAPRRRARRAAEARDVHELSGSSVQAAARFFKVDPEHVLVVHDEGDFDLGRLQARAGRRARRAQRLRSIAQSLGTQDFLRLRIGVGRPERGDRGALADYVLSELRAARRRGADRRRAADAVESILATGSTRRSFTEYNSDVSDVVFVRGDGRAPAERRAAAPRRSRGGR